ncbi:hypothetical protein [Vibrio phage LP.2]|nr:hypothetical protein [Vibrio phage LP.2]
MSDTVSTVQNASLGATMTTGLLPVITQNATAISVLCTIIFGVIYASCAIWNAYSNHKLKRLNKQAMIDNLIRELNDNGEEDAARAVRRVSK